MIFDYWLKLVPHRPPYFGLCNFDEFWIYDFNIQLNEPGDRIPVPEVRSLNKDMDKLLDHQDGVKLRIWPVEGDFSSFHRDIIAQ